MQPYTRASSELVYSKLARGVFPSATGLATQLCALLARSYHSSSTAPPGACARRRRTAIRDGTSSLSATATLWRAAIRISLDPFGTFMRPLPKPDGETDMIHNAQHVQRTHTLSVEDWCLQDWLLTVVVPPPPPWVNKPIYFNQCFIRRGREAPRSYRLYMTHTPASVRA